MANLVGKFQISLAFVSYPCYVSEMMKGLFEGSQLVCVVWNKCIEYLICSPNMQ